MQNKIFFAHFVNHMKEARFEKFPSAMGKDLMESVPASCSTMICFLMQQIGFAVNTIIYIITHLPVAD